MTRNCILCRRRTLPGFGVCSDCLDRLMHGFAPSREVHVARLSAAMPELQVKGRRTA